MADQPTWVPITVSVVSAFASILGAALAWISKRNGDNSNREHEVKMTLLEKQAQTSVDVAKISFTKLTELRAIAILEIHQLLLDFDRLAFDYVNAAPEEPPPVYKKTRDDLRASVRKHSVYFARELCDQIDDLLFLIEKAATNRRNARDGLRSEGEEKEQARAAYRSINDFALKELRPLIESIRDEFRQLLGVRVERQPSQQTT